MKYTDYELSETNKTEYAKKVTCMGEGFPFDFCTLYMIEDKGIQEDWIKSLIFEISAYIMIKPFSHFEVKNIEFTYDIKGDKLMNEIIKGINKVLKNWTGNKYNVVLEDGTIRNIAK